MVEPKALLVGGVGVGVYRAHELLAAEAEQVRGDSFADRLGRQLLHRVGREDEADHRGGLDDRALLAVEPVETCGEQRLDRRGHGEIS